MKQSSLPRVSARRDEKRERTGARGPVCEFAKRYPCAICGRASTDAMHATGNRVGKGHGDWTLVLYPSGITRWVCKVAGGCRECHRVYDDNVVGRRRTTPEQQAEVEEQAVLVGEQWAREVGVDLTSPRHPYDQWRDGGARGVADLEF